MQKDIVFSEKDKNVKLSKINLEEDDNVILINYSVDEDVCSTIEICKDVIHATNTSLTVSESLIILECVKEKSEHVNVNSEGAVSIKEGHKYKMVNICNKSNEMLESMEVTNNEAKENPRGLNGSVSSPVETNTLNTNVKESMPEIKEFKNKGHGKWCEHIIYVSNDDEIETLNSSVESVETNTLNTNVKESMPEIKELKNKDHGKWCEHIIYVSNDDEIETLNSSVESVSMNGKRESFILKTKEIEIDMNCDKASENCIDHGRCKSSPANVTKENDLLDRGDIATMSNYKIAQLNVNGWNKNNSKLREKIILAAEADFISLNETHLKHNECISIKGYNWVGANRIMQNRRAVRAFGGVGLLYKEEIGRDFTVRILDKSIDGFLSVLFCHRKADTKLVINVCYLPPDNSVWGRDSTTFLTHIVGELYRQEEVDLSICIMILLKKWMKFLRE